VRGWYVTAPESEREFACKYLNTDGSDLPWDMIRAIWSSVAVYAVTTMQDALSLGGEARMNFPSKLGGNWEWRMSKSDMSEELANRLKEMNLLYLR
jgi:4-alpha-glucanotransferase